MSLNLVAESAVSHHGSHSLSPHSHARINSEGLQCLCLIMHDTEAPDTRWESGAAGMKSHHCSTPVAGSIPAESPWHAQIHPSVPQHSRGVDSLRF